MSKISLIPGTIALNEQGEIGIIQLKDRTQYVGFSLYHHEKAAVEGYDGNEYSYVKGAEWSSIHPEVLCHADDLLLLGQKMYAGEEVPFEIPSTKNMDGYLALCTVDILGFVTSNERGHTDMGENRWPGYHLVGGEYLNKAFKGTTIDYSYKANGPWSSSKPRPVIKASDLITMGAEIKNWAQGELVTV